MPMLPCPHCGHKLSVAISQAGSELPCPGCQQVVSIPKLGELRRLEAEAMSTPDAPQSPAAGIRAPATSEASQGSRILFGGLLAIAGIAALAGAFCLVRYLAIEVPTTTQGHIEEVAQVFKQVPPAQLVREWQQMEKYGLDVATPYRYHKLATEKANWARNGLVCLAILIAALGTATAIGLRESRRTVKSALST